jgi:AraC family transcriptional regulator, arabinose operon regulatory protein
MQMSELTNQTAETENREHHEYFKEKSFYTPADIVDKEMKSEILANLLVTWAGCYTKAYGHLVDQRLIQDYVLIYCVDGYGWLKLAGGQWTIRPGDLFVCPPGIIHSYGAANQDPWTKYWIHFKGKSAEAYMDLLNISAESPVLHLGENVKILTWLQDIFQVLKTGYTHSNLIMATSYLSNILSYINSLSVNEWQGKQTGINLDKIINYMIDNLAENLTLKQMAEYACLSKYHFVHLFKNKAGYSPVDYYNRLKIRQACELLESSTAQISSISIALGFNNPYYFSITFKKIIGKSPSLYRETVRNMFIL